MRVKILAHRENNCWGGVKSNMSAILHTIEEMLTEDDADSIEITRVRKDGNKSDAKGSSG